MRQSPRYRKRGHATALILAAEAEAKRRGCKKVIVDTFSFQAPDFYRKLGYSEWGRLTEMAGVHERYFFPQGALSATDLRS
ncbi:GNAT family N-acetyltransferase [Paraburkholderia sp. GAS82]|uniref:GNAT family N-acetyltransferase n=1 Tax=Paraburkholderia sp. GAS82 TaxID=3035137 RepID=UPI003D194FFA